MNRTSQQLNILIVEDQTSDFTALIMVLQSLGHKTKVCFDGEQAMTEIERQKIDLVILDWNLPYLSGEEFLFSLEFLSSKQSANRLLNIILHSGENLEEKNIGSTHFYTIMDIWKKPLTAVELLKRMKEINLETFQEVA